MTPDQTSSPDALEVALDAALARIESHGAASETWLRAHCGAGWERVQELLRFDSELGGGLAPGALVGPFRVRRRLGAGGMGRVFLVEAHRPAFGLAVGESAALKVPHHHLLARPGARRRFEREVRAGQRLSAPGIVRTLGMLHGTTALPDRPALVMEFAAGCDLGSVLRSAGPLSDPACFAVLRDAGEALAAVHAARMIHRDVKPGNLQLSPSGRVKLLDLGIAWLQDELVRLSRSGDFVGSFAYAAPEQFTRGDEPLDPRADLYSLGVTVFELRTGHGPWGDGPDAADPVLRTNTAPLRCSDFVPDVHPALDDLIERLLHTAVEGRPASAAEVARAAREHCGSAPIVVPASGGAQEREAACPGGGHTSPVSPRDGQPGVRHSHDRPGANRPLAAALLRLRRGLADLDRSVGTTLIFGCGGDEPAEVIARRLHGESRHPLLRARCDGAGALVAALLAELGPRRTGAAPAPTAADALALDALALDRVSAAVSTALAARSGEPHAISVSHIERAGPIERVALRSLCVASATQPLLLAAFSATPALPAWLQDELRHTHVERIDIADAAPPRTTRHTDDASLLEAAARLGTVFSVDELAAATGRPRLRLLQRLVLLARRGDSVVFIEDDAAPGTVLIRLGTCGVPTRGAPPARAARAAPPGRRDGPSRPAHP